MERISTDELKGFDTKISVYEIKPNKSIHFSLHLQLCNPRHSWDRAFITEDNWPEEKT